jgi:hypothetical protein
MRDRFALLIAEGNKPGVPHTPLASASCSGIVTATVNTTTPSNASAATMAIIAIDVVVVISLTHLPNHERSVLETHSLPDCFCIP